MSEKSILGTCPDCGRELSRAAVLLEWEEADGDGIFAECMDCDDVVRPVLE
ncbi:hypothetical protein [Halospeciosus flavus]|uniref:DUF7837 domain-containing protein n=1 Tax=Halospeciosus flavus TaxID=3032283 RepID=A0ABD5Z3K8_9EURY|nr:hypothetical protein [Halospeciosus flavus]